MELSEEQLEKEKFLKYEAWTLSWNGAVQHNKTWINAKSPKNKVFKSDLKEFCDEILKSYTKPVEEEEHIGKIKSIQDETEKNKKLFANGSMSFGQCQKILNLYLKYQWCFGKEIAKPIAEPPHCPIDNTVIKEIKRLKGIENIKDYTWSKFDQKDYESCIEKIKKIKQTDSLACWELKIYNKNRYKSKSKST